MWSAGRASWLAGAGLLVLLAGSPAAAQQPPPPPRTTLPPPRTTLPPPTTLPPRTLPPPSLPPSTPLTTTAQLAPSTTERGSGGGGSSAWPIAGVLGGLAALAAVGVVVPLRRRGRAPLASPTAPAPLDALLDVSRRLTAAASSGDIDRAVLRDAMELVPARGAALVRQDGAALTLARETAPGLLVAEGLAEGVIRRVAETGQPLLQVSASEPAIRNLPAALVAVPLVGGGRVEAVLVLLRSPDQPFEPSERDTLVALAPVAAAALHSADEARAAIEATLLDPLTRIGNRRRFDADLEAATGEGEPVALLMVDLDHFKTVNDTHGHPAGDELLRGVAARIRDAVRPGDGVYRFGGEEFCALLRSAPTRPEAVEVAERVRAAIAEAPFPIGGDAPLSATASLGVAFATGGSGADLLARADVALYEAKHAGRNRVSVSEA